MRTSARPHLFQGQHRIKAFLQDGPQVTSQVWGLRQVWGTAAQNEEPLLPGSMQTDGSGQPEVHPCGQNKSRQASKDEGPVPDDIKFAKRSLSLAESC